MVRLVLINEQGSTIVNNNVAVINDIPIDVTLQIADVREPENGAGSFTKTVDIPGNPEVNQFFEDVYSLNVSLQTYNPNLKVRAIYYKDELPQFEGYLQILGIEIDEPTQKVIYKCNILGEVLTLFNQIKDKQLTDLYNYSIIPTPTYLPLSIYNHTLSASTIQTSWNLNSPQGTGVGYVYAPIDRGHVQSYYYGASGFSVEQYAGCAGFFAKAYVDRIFQQAGFTYTSNFFNSNLFKNLVITPTKTPSLSPTILGQNKFLANISTNQVLNKTLTGSGPLFSFNSTSPDVVAYNNEVYDAGNKYNNTASPIVVGPNTIQPYNFRPDVTKLYNISADATISFQFFDAGNVDRTSTTNAVSGNITLGVGSGTQIPPLTSMTFGSTNSNSFSVQVPNALLLSGQAIYGYFSFNNLSFINNSHVITQMRVTITAGAFSAEFASPSPYSGQNIDALDLIPENYTQDEFMRDLRKLFNLYFTVDKTNPKNLIVEPRPDFYLSTPLNWENKHDRNSIVEIKPVGELDAIKYKFSYSDDGDYFNTKYKADFKDSYGYEEVDVQNDFIKSEKEIKVSLAPTPLVGNSYNNGLILSTYRKQENNLISEFKAKPRILYWGGLIAASNNAKPISFAFNNSIQNTFPYLGHLDNPFNPQFDLNFGLVSYVYYVKPNQTLTNNNLYNKYYSQYINQITDKDSKIVKTRFYLTEDDIHRFEFRYPVYTIINNEPGYYLVNKIVFNPMADETSEVELLKLVDYPIFTPQSVDFVNGLGWTENLNLRTTSLAPVSGDNNFSNSPSSMIVGGENNFINEESQSVSLIGSENVQLQDTVDTFVGVGLTSTSLIESNSVNLFDSFRVNSSGMSYESKTFQTVTGDFTVDGKTRVYLIDLDSIGVPVTCVWDAALYPIQLTFKIVSNTSNIDFIIDGGTAPVDGNTSPFTTGAITNDSYEAYSDGSHIYII
jgi:hypothetical protein